MAITNHERVGKGLSLLTKGLAPFVERELQAVHGGAWKDKASLGAFDVRTRPIPRRCVE